MKTVDKLYKQIMEYWEACAYCRSVTRTETGVLFRTCK